MLFGTTQLETNYRFQGQMKQPTKGIAAVSFQDLNHDGWKDIVLVTNCENDTGEYAGKIYKIGDVLQCIMKEEQHMPYCCHVMAELLRMLCLESN